MTAAVVSLYQARIDALRVPSLYDNEPLALSPYVFKLELVTIRNDLLKLIRSTKSAKPQLLQLLNTLDEKEYIVNKQWQQVQNDCLRQKEQHQESGDSTDCQNEDDIDEIVKPDEKDSLTSLRQRLLSKDKSILDADESANSTARTNEYHESLQLDMFNELLDLALVLKSTTLNFSNTLMGEDKDMINQTTNQLNSNADAMHRVGSNLNNYVSNKLGGKISLFWMIKTALILFVVFVFILIVAKLLPRM